MEEKDIENQNGGQEMPKQPHTDFDVSWAGCLIGGAVFSLVIVMIAAAIRAAVLIIMGEWWYE